MGFLSIVLISLFLWLLYDFIKKNKKLSSQDPKSPWALPIIGHLHLFGVRPHRSFTELSKSLGGIFTIWMGDERSMVVTDPKILKELFVKQGSLFINRPRYNRVEIFSGGYIEVSFANDEYWKTNRRLVSSALTKTKTISLISSIEKEACYLIESMNSYAKNEQPFYPQKYCSNYTLNIVMNIVFSKTISPDEIIEMGAIEKLNVPFLAMLKKLGSGSIDDFISITKPFFYLENKKHKQNVETVYKFLEVFYDKHLECFDESSPMDLMDQLILSTKGKRKDICIHVALDFLLAGTDTIASTIHWLCLFFANNQNIQEKAYHELISVVGNDCSFVDVKHRENCNYLVGAIKETLRIRTPAPLSVLRISSEDYTTTSGIYIPKGTQIIPNLYGMGQNYVDDPSAFKPERWVEYYKNKQTINDNRSDSIEEGATTPKPSSDCKNYYNDLDNIVLPFSIGIRSCPGKVISESTLFIACSNILLNFKISSIDGKKIDETEIFGITIHPTIVPIKLTKRK